MHPTGAEYLISPITGSWKGKFFRMPSPRPAPCQAAPGMRQLSAAEAKGGVMGETDPFGGVQQAAESKDVYVFYTGTNPELVDEFDPDANPQLRFLGSMEGWRYSAMAVVEVENLYDLPGVANGVPSSPDDPVEDAAKPVMYGPRVLRSSKHYPYFGFVRVSAEKGREVEVLRAIDEDSVSGYAASALVSGTFHILVEIGGDTLDEMRNNLANGLEGIDGIVEQQGAEVVGLYYYRPDKRMVGENEA